MKKYRLQQATNRDTVHRPVHVEGVLIVHVKAALLVACHYAFKANNPQRI